MWLRPLTINHAIFLTAIGSPFVIGGTIEKKHVALAAYVLSRPCNAAAKGLRTRRGRWFLRVWSWLIGLRCDRLDHVLARQAMLDYFKEAFEEPQPWEGEGDMAGRPPGSTFLQALKVALQARLNCSHAEALNYPLREAIWDLACDSEREGKVQLVSEEERAEMDEALRLRAQKEEADFAE